MSVEATAGSTSTAVASLFGFKLTFTQGFLAGQLSVLIIVLIAIRYIIFEDSQSGNQGANRVKTGVQNSETIRKSRKSISRKDGISSDGVNIAKIMSDIMSKVRYEVDSHPGETIDWVNVIIAQALAGYRKDIAMGGWSGHNKKDDVQKSAREWMEDILNARTVGRGMNFLDPIEVTHVTFGDAYPIFTNARVRPADDTGRMRVEVDVDYSDCISLSIETKLVINLPRPRFAVLPISLGLTVERFSGTLAIELFSSEESSFLPQSRLSAPPRSRHELHFSLHPDFALDAVATSLVGSRAKLQDVPKIEQLLVGRLRSFVHDRFVWPKYWSLTLPNLVPKSGVDLQPQKDSSDNLNAPGNAQIAGQGNVLEEEKANEEEEGAFAYDHVPDGFFDHPPPLFTRANQAYPMQMRHPEANSPIPGSLPTVEAWRTQSAATGVNPRLRPRPEQSARAPLGPSSLQGDTPRYRNGMSVASSAAY